MEQWIYDNRTVEEHPLYPSCHSTLNDISNRDYPNTDYFAPDIECLDMDYYEQRILNTGQADNTVDAVIGICSFENNRPVNPRLLLVELRMNYQSTSHLSKTEMERKVVHTQDILSREKAIERKSLFVFNNKIAPQAVNWFSRQSRTGGEIKNCMACSVTGFPHIVKSYSDFPYTPIHKEEDIRINIDPYCQEIDWRKFRRQTEYWCTVAYKYLYKNPSEFEHIKTVIKEIWSDFKQEERSLDEEERFEMELLEEKFEFLKH